MSKHIDKTQSARQTQPIETRKGLLKAYEDIKKWLTLGESQGRLWIYEKANSYWKDNPVRLPPAPNDEDIYELHRVMFSALFDWAGQTRQKDVGPGGRVFVRYYEVPVQLKYRFENLQARVSGLTYEDVDFDVASEIVAKAHHDFEYVHPFEDTNGRTGRVLDHYILWHTLGLIGADYDSTPQIEHFPDERYEKQYSDALKAADDHDLGPLQEFYRERIEEALESVGISGPVE